MTDRRRRGSNGRRDGQPDGRAAGHRPLVVLCPHFDPDTAPTGTVMTRIVEELVSLGHDVHVVTALPWYRNHGVEAGWEARLARTEHTSWGSVARLNPFAGDDKTNLARRALGFVAYSVLAGVYGLRAGGWFRRCDAVIAMSPPLTLGLTGRLVAWLRRAPLIFNIQDVFPDAAVETGAITNRLVIRSAEMLERASYRSADAVTVLSSDLQENVARKIPERMRAKVRVIANFVDTDRIVPGDRATGLRSDLGLGDGPVVLYAGNVGFSQSLDLVVHAAAVCPEVQFLINGNGAARPTLEAAAAGLANVHFADFIAHERLSELLATGDLHVVPLRRGLGAVSVPSKTYSIMAAARPVLAAIDPDTAVPRILADSRGGVSIPPDDPDAFADAIRRMLADPSALVDMGRRGRAWVEREASPRSVGVAYHRLVDELRR